MPRARSRAREASAAAAVELQEQYGAEHRAPARRRAAQLRPVRRSPRRLPSLEGEAQPRFQPLRHVGVPKAQRFNPDGRLATPGWASRSAGGASQAASRSMLMTPYSRSLHSRFIAAPSEGLGVVSSEPDLGVSSMMQQQGAYVSGHLRSASNTPAFLASELKPKTTTRGGSYIALANMMMQNSFHGQVSVLDRAMQEQEYIRHIPHSQEPAANSAGRRIQTHWRGFVWRVWYTEQRAAARLIQAAYRGHMGRMLLKRMRAAAVRIQACFRCWSGRRRFVEKLLGSLVIQCGYRCHLARVRVANRRALKQAVLSLIDDWANATVAQVESKRRREAARRRAMQMTRMIAQQNLATRKVTAVNSLLTASEFGPVVARLSVADGEVGLDFTVNDVFAGATTYEEQVKMVFDLMDADGSGTLGIGEIAKLGESMRGEPLPHAELVAAMRSMDADGSGGVDFAEFQEWWKRSLPKDGSAGDAGAFGGFFQRGTPKKASPGAGRPRATQHSDSVVRRLFDKADTDGSGSLDRQEIAQLANTLGAKVRLTCCTPRLFIRSVSTLSLWVLWVAYSWRTSTRSMR